MLRRPLLRRIAYVRRNRCSALLAALGLYILANPLLSGSSVGTMIASVSIVAIMVPAVWAIRVRRRMFWVVLVLALATAWAIVMTRLGVSTRWAWRGTS